MTTDPTPPIGDDEWRRRFILLNLVRIGGSVVCILGLAIWQTNLVQPGGWPEVGLPMALLGLLISFPGAQALVRRWRTPPTP